MQKFGKAVPSAFINSTLVMRISPEVQLLLGQGPCPVAELATKNNAATKSDQNLNRNAENNVLRKTNYFSLQEE